MIDGTEPINPIVITNSIEGHDILDCQSIGITLKQYMVIEFTKALMGRGEYGTSDEEGNVILAIRQANEVIKQLNEEQ